MIKRFISSLVLAFMCLIAAPLTASAYQAYSGVQCSGEAAKSAVCKDKTTKDPLTGDNGMLIKITNIIAFFAGAIAIIMIIVSAIRFTTSGSDISTGSRHDSDVEDARKTIANALIGLAVIIMARTIIVFVLNRI